MIVTLAKPESKQSVSGSPREYRWHADNFDRACDLGVFGPNAQLGMDDTLAPLAALEAVLAVRDLLGQQKEGTLE